MMTLPSSADADVALTQRRVAAGLVMPTANARSLHLDPISRKVASGAHAILVFDGTGRAWPSSGDSHAELGSRFRQAIQPTTIDSVATISGGTPCPYSPWRVTVASAANITVQPSAAPHSRVRACASRTAAVSSSAPVTKWNQCGYPHLRYSP